MDTSLNPKLAQHLQSYSQIARVVTEAWARENLRCPKCGSELVEYKANTKTVDFSCSDEQGCGERFQLKAGRHSFQSSVTGAEYNTTLASVKSGEHPSLLLMRYSRDRTRVTRVQAVPRRYITESVIRPRKPLPDYARRAGWQGCTFRLADLPAHARIDVLVTDATGTHAIPATDVSKRWADAESAAPVT